MQLFELLVEPVSGFKLEVYSIEKYELKNGKEIVKIGFLYSKESKTFYPILNWVPVLLTFRTTLTEKFLLEYKEILSTDEFKGYSLPNLEPMKGEKSIQTTFTEEWQD